jgi:dihydroorotase
MMKRASQAFILAAALLAVPISAEAAEYDLLIKGGHLIDPKNQSNGPADVAVREGKIAHIAANIDPSQAQEIVDAAGLYVVPGLIDLHTHVFFGTAEDSAYSNGFSAVPPDGFTFRSGVTTVVDAGGAGWKDFLQFKRQTIDHSQTRVLAFINIVGSGMKGGPIEQNLNDMDPRLTALRAEEFPGLIVGVKVAHYSGNDWEAVDRAVAAGKLAELPVMVDFGYQTPPLPLGDLFLVHLRPGDIFTHTFSNPQNRDALVGIDGKVQPKAWEASRRGIVFDVGHGAGSFVFRQVVPAVKEGFFPNTISSDLHVRSMNGGMKNLLNVMSKFLNLGLSLSDVIDKSTWAPAQVISRDDLGHLSPGSEADLTILSIQEGSFGFLDVEGSRMSGTKKLECELTLRAGRVVWDLNGLAAKDWSESPNASAR